ncbi:hypothetical protein HYX18_03295 [Candidatus Woesearchaeota archaeon]|nr:hypothetical protein [Candidatus Woesearchaeota archaeon]
MAQEFQNEQYSELNELSGRIRILESKYSLARDRIFLINQNMVESHKKLMVQIDSLNSDIKEIKNDVFVIKESLRTLIKEFDSFAKKEDVKVLEKYINMWNPLKFVTEDQVKELLKTSGKKRGRKKI